jgi:hypothetical protein
MQHGLTVTEQNLDHSTVDVLFEQVGCEAMAQLCGVYAGISGACKLRVVTFCQHVPHGFNAAVNHRRLTTSIQS